MGIENAMEISVSAINAEEKRMEIISSNIANINTTRSIDGGPYRRREVILEAKPFSEVLEIESGKIEKKLSGGGVRVKDVIEDLSPLQKVYNPSHPDADKDGYVLMPNVKLSKEYSDMVNSSRMHEANVNVYNIAKKMAQDTLQIP